jgi:hypothetical protein
MSVSVSAALDCAVTEVNASRVLAVMDRLTARIVEIDAVFQSAQWGVFDSVGQATLA